MTPIENALERPAFDMIDLEIDSETAGGYIEEAVKGLSVSDTDEGTKYRTADGVVVGLVGSRPAGSEDTNATLAYRTDPTSHAATRKAAKIREALDPHTINR